MATQEAIDIIKKIINYIEIAVSRGSAKNPLPIIEALCMGIEALDKQVSKEPIENYYMDSDPITGEPYPVGIAYFCPNCGAQLAEKDSVCKCGQAISWEGLER